MHCPENSRYENILSQLLAIHNPTQDDPLRKSTRNEDGCACKLLLSDPHQNRFPLQVPNISCTGQRRHEGRVWRQAVVDAPEIPRYNTIPVIE